MAPRVDRVLPWLRPRRRRAGALRQLPRVKRYLAYLPEGPVLDWGADDLDDQLTAMVHHLKQQGAFAVRMGPPVVTRVWSAATVKSAIASDTRTRLADVPPDDRDETGGQVQAVLREAGWRPVTSEAGSARDSRSTSSGCRSAGAARTTCSRA